MREERLEKVLAPGTSERLEKVLAPGTSENSLRETSSNPGRTEAVANLDETLRLLQAHVSSLGMGLASIFIILKCIKTFCILKGYLY